MITKEILKEIIDLNQTFQNGIERIETALCGKPYSCNLLESDWVIAHEKMFDAFLKSYFNESGQNLLYWWLYESVDKIIYQKIDSDLFEDKKEIQFDVNSIDDLWDYMIKHKEDYFID